MKTFPSHLVENSLPKRHEKNEGKFVEYRHSRVQRGGRSALPLREIADYLFKSQVDVAEVIVVDDGSDDGTSDAAVREEETFRRVGATLRIIRNPVNMGKGYSVRRGIQEAIYERVLCTDADMSTPIQELDKLLSVSSERKCDVVIIE